MALRIVVWNVSHGLAVSLMTPNGKLVAYDAGRNESFSPLAYLEQQGYEGLDYFFLSHPHADHLCDIDAVIRLNPRAIWRAKPTEMQVREAARGTIEEGIVDRYERELDQRYIYPTPENPLVPAWSGGCDFAVFGPPPHENLNNMSLIVFVGYGGTYIALTGDLEKPGWVAMLGNGDFVRCLAKTTILLAPHHGREAGVCAEGFRLMRPKLCVISDGPFSDTSSGVYSALAAGARVRQNGSVVERRALSTRKDGHVVITVESNGTWFVDIA